MCERDSGAEMIIYFPPVRVLNSEGLEEMEEKKKKQFSTPREVVHRLISLI